jgi:hypothetical protein
VTQFTVPQYLIDRSQASRLTAIRVAIYTRRPVASVSLLLIYIVLLGPACPADGSVLHLSPVLPFDFLLSRFVLEKPRIRGSDHRNNLRALTLTKLPTRQFNYTQAVFVTTTTA